MDIHICNLPLIDDGNTVQVKSVWSDSNMTISILYENAAWKGSVLYSQLSQLSRTFNISEEEYREKCKQVLTSDQGMKDFSYHLENNCFVWKKKILTDMKIKFGQIDVLSVPVSEVSKEIITTLMSYNNTYKSKVRTYEQEIVKLKSENTELLHTLEEFTNAKIRSEQILFGKFATLLNIKKQRIACLEKLLFKNLCSDQEESKAFKQVEQMNFDSDTEPEDEESMDTSDPAPGPSRVRVDTIDCEDTDEEAGGLPDTRSNTPSPTCDIPATHEALRDTLKTNKTLAAKKLTETPGPAKKLKLTSETPNRSESNSTDNVQLGKIQPNPTLLAKDQNYHKPESEMNSQELLDLM